MAKVRLKLICPSNEDDNHKLVTSGCSRGACAFWGVAGPGIEGCTAGLDLRDAFQQWLRPDRDAKMPECPLAGSCTWNVNAVARGEPGCVPRRLGLICEHQGGEWNTFQMADPDEECWGQDWEMNAVSEDGDED